VNGPADLAVDATGTVTFNYAIGDSTPLSSFTSGGNTIPSTTTFKGNVSTDGLLKVWGNAAVASNPVSFATPLLFVEGTFAGGGQDVTLNVPGVAIFSSDVSGLGALQINSTGETTFQSTVAGNAGISQADDAGAVYFSGSVTLGATGTTSLLGNVVLDSISGALVFDSSNPVTIGGGVTPDKLTLRGGNGITLKTTTAGITLVVNALVDGDSILNSDNLTLNTTGTATFSAAVGIVTPIGTGTGAALTILSSGATTFNSTLATASGITQDNAAGLVTFKDTVDIAAGNTDSTFNANVTLDGLTLTSAGTVTIGNGVGADTLTISAALVTVDTSATNAAVTVHSATTMNSDLTLTTGSGVVTLNGTVNGASNLILDTTGNTDINGVIGATTPLTSVTTNAGGTTLLGANISVDTGTLTFNDPVSLDTAAITLTGTTGATLNFNSTLNGANDLTLAFAGATTAVGTVGNSAPLGDGTGAALTINSTGTTEFQNTVATASGITQAGTAGTITFRNNVNVGNGDTNTTFNANVVLDGLTFTAADPVTFGDAGADTLTISAALVTVDTSA
ncbi:MAG: hypothetical protein AAB403_16890, partial [Planctomycetota bacterium]